MSDFHTRPLPTASYVRDTAYNPYYAHHDDVTIHQLVGALLAVPADDRADVRKVAEALLAEFNMTYREIQ